MGTIYGEAGLFPRGRSARYTGGNSRARFTARPVSDADPTLNRNRSFIAPTQSGRPRSGPAPR